MKRAYAKVVVENYRLGMPVIHYRPKQMNTPVSLGP
jgi:hypothetical protein